MTLKKLFLGMAACLLTLSVAACRAEVETEPEGAAEEIGEDIDRGAREIGEGIERAGDRLEDAGDRIAD